MQILSYSFQLSRPRQVTREAIVRLENEIRQLPQESIEPVHRFSEGVYAREITIPAGCVLTGKVHKTVHLNIISKGDITVWTEEGMKRIKAPFTLVSQPGTKRVGYAHEDTVWTTIHGTHETDLEKLEQDLIEPEQIEYQGDFKWLGSQ
jgi:quercetin dioxygenase-like cupin family protein